MERQDPPENANDWSDQQWIDWLSATDAQGVEAEETTPPWGRTQAAHSTGGRVLGNAMIGLARALYGREEEKPAIVVESSQPGADHLDLHLDLEHPERSVATFKAVAPPHEPGSDEPA